jgi:hypothetical protein
MDVARLKLNSAVAIEDDSKKACFGATPKPTRETRVLPRHNRCDFAGRFPDEWR